ncbi:hypothetical protein KY290_010836 [Solanum tuberosum]|uniref:Uncharacterized protein n=1 Tax=Solanum tuberosum TaxID=4113 RepID=A0ABQ7W109_SOLTU|nr:hypothetical protein KY290_010836 [Solanum tuberosum]
MGDYGCDYKGYGCEDNVDYGGYDDSHDQEPNENESYYSGGEYEKNVEHDSYGEDKEEEGSCGGSYDDVGTCYTSHSQDEGKVKYNTLLYKKYEEHVPKACEDSYSYSCANLYPSRSSVYGYTSSSQSHPRGRREYERCVKGLGTKMIDFPIFKGNTYIDWEWQCEQIFQRHDLVGLERRPLYALGNLKGLALGWWTQEERLRTLQRNTHPLTWEGLKGLMWFKYVPKG